MTEPLHIRRQVYAWEQNCWDIVGADASRQLDQNAAHEALARLWWRYLGHGEPLHRTLPELRIEPMAGAGIASSERHSITVAPGDCRTPILMHECAHLLAFDGHGPDWRELLMTMWADAWNLPASVSRQLERQHGLAVQAQPAHLPSLAGR